LVAKVVYLTFAVIVLSSLLISTSYTSSPFHVEDGGVTLNGAKVVKSLEFADATKTGIVHEVDGLISPSILWRYADQREFA
jgi:hypothetical protein